MMKQFKSILAVMFVALLGITSLPLSASGAGDNVPRVVITKYEATNGALTTDEATAVTFTVKNTSTTTTAYSILLSCYEDSNKIIAQYGESNQAYIKALAPEEETTITMNLIAESGTDVTTMACTMEVSYTYGADDNSATTYSTLSFPIKEDSLKIKRITVPQQATVDTDVYLNIICENTTLEDAYGAQMKITGTDMEDTTIDLGTVLNGSRKSQEVYVNFSKTGTQTIQIELSYKDSQGQVYTKTTQSYQIEVNDQEQTVDKDTETDTTSKSNIIGKRFIAYVGGFVLSISAVGVIFARKRLKGDA